MNVLELHGIEKRFGATMALAGTDLEISPGQVHALIGENGAGKSTLVNILSGTFPPDSGQMRLAGEPYRPRGPAQAREAGVTHIHQEISLCPHLTVAENILLGAEPSRLGVLARRRLFADAARLLTEFGGHRIDPRSRAGSLSLADQQVVEICRALARETRLILMDEPTSSLARVNVDRLFRLIAQLRDRGIAILYISHFLEEIREVADRFTVLRDGRSVGSGELESVSDEALIALMAGRRLETVLKEGAPGRSAPREVLLDVEDLAAPPRLKSASFQLHRGEVLGIAGLVGSGRTDLIRALFGLTVSTKGRVQVAASELPPGKDGGVGRVANGLGFLSEDRKGEGLALSLSVADNVTMSRFSTCTRGGWIDLSRQAEQAQHVMLRTRIKAAGPQSPVLQLSGGNQQRVAFGRLLHQDPDVFLLDEPARGIDVATKSDIYREIARLAARGKAILLVSSYLPELLTVCDRIAVMSRGRLSAARPVSEWTRDSLLRAAVGAGEK